MGPSLAKQVPKPYQSRVQRTTSDIADPNDLSFLGTRPKPGPPAPSRPPPAATVAAPASAPSKPSPASQRPSQSSSSSSPLNGFAPVEAEAPPQPTEQPRDIGRLTANRSSEDLMQDALALSALATAKKQNSGVFMRGGAAMLDDFENANRTLRHALAAMHAQLQTQAQQQSQQQSDMISLHHQEKAALQDRNDHAFKMLKEETEAASAVKANEADQLRQELNTANTRNETDAQEKLHLKASIEGLKRSNRSLITSNASLLKDLEIERGPAVAQARRLSRSQDTRLEQDEKDRQQKEKDNRRVQRASYADFQDFFQQGSRDIRRWLNVDVQAHETFGHKTTLYWRQAAVSFESFVAKIKAKDDLRAWDLEVTSRHLGAGKTARKLREFENHIIRRNTLFKALSTYMQTQLQNSTHAREEFQDLVWDFGNSTWDNLKIDSHEVRHFARILRFSGHKSPDHMAHQYLVDSQNVTTELPLRQLYRNLSQDQRALKRAATFEKDPERHVYLRKRLDAVSAQIDLLAIARELSTRHVDLVKADWLRRESLVHTAVVDSTRPLVSANAELRMQIERRVQTFADLGLDRKQWFLKYNELYNTRKLIDELDRITYRNHVLLEHHGKMDKAEVEKLKAVPLRRYQESMGYLRALLGSAGDHGIRSWATKLTERHRARQSSSIDILKDQEDPIISPTPKSARRLKKERMAGSQKSSTKDSVVKETNSPRDLVRRVTANKDEDVVKGVKSNNVEDVVKRAKSNENEDTVRTVKSNKVGHVVEKAASKEKAVQEDDADDFFSDSPMDAFEALTPENTGSGGGIETFEIETPAIETSAIDPREDSQLVSTDVESFSPVTGDAVKTVSSLPKPSYKKSAHPPSRSIFRGASVAIQPKKGVLPKPDFRARRRPKLSFKSMKPRKHSFHTQASNASENAPAADEEDEPGEAPVADEKELFTADQREKDSSDTLSSPAKEKEVHVALKFQIPEQSFKTALMASSSSSASFWKHSLYKGPAGETIKIHYCVRFDQAEREAKAFLDEGVNVVGFDMEWEMGSKPETDGIKNSVSLIQVASETRVALFQIALFYGETAERLMPPSLRTILESPKIVKAGVNIAGDYSRLKRCFDIEGRGIFELSHLYKVVKYGETDPSKVDRRLCAMASQVHEILFLPLEKGNVRTSSWSLKLNQEQVQYAASDAYAGFRLYDALESKRKLMDPTPPRPAFYELHQPFILGNGKPPPSKKKAVAAKMIAVPEQAAAAGAAVAAKVEENQAVTEAAVEDEVAAAEEALDNAQEANEDGRGSEDEFYSCESDFEERSERKTTPT